MRDRGEDIAPAFAALAEMAGPWALGLLMRAAAEGADLSRAVRPLVDLVRSADATPSDVRLAEEGRQAIGILACHYFFQESWKEVDILLEKHGSLFRGGVAEIINRQLRNAVAPSKAFAHDARRQRAASAMAFLLLFHERPDPIYGRRDTVSDLLDSPSADVVAGAVFGLRQAVRAGRARLVEPFLPRLARSRSDPVVAEILEAVEREQPS